MHDRFTLTSDPFSIDGCRIRIPNLGWVRMRECKKAKGKLATLHARIAVIRSDALHQLTTNLTRRFHTSGMEDLNVRGMVKNRYLARSVADMGFFEFRRQLEYKSAMRGSQIVVADRFYPSSKTCSGCGTRHDRDVNAAINLKNMAVSSTVTACAEEGSGRARRSTLKPA